MFVRLVLKQERFFLFSVIRLVLRKDRFYFLFFYFFIFLSFGLYYFEKSLQELQDMSSVVVPRIIERFGRYHKTLSPEDGPPEVDQLSGMSHNPSRTFSFFYKVCSVGFKIG